MNKNTIYTIGYGGLKSVYDLKHIVDQNDITRIIDIRSKPNGRRFSRKSLEALFGDMYESRIDMGGLGFEINQYDAWLGRASDGLSDVQELSKTDKVLIMCMEKDPTTCHRSYFVGAWLEERNHTVVHL